MNQSARRLSYLFLCALPFLFLVVGGARTLRIPGVYQSIGVVLVVATLTAAWFLGARTILSRLAQVRSVALAGTLFIVPWAVNSLLWVGIGAPFQATPAENYMRFLVLLADAIVVASGFVALKEALSVAGERFYSTLGFAAGLTAGTAYLACISLSLGVSAARLHSGQAPDVGAVLSDFYSVLEFVACVLTYLATAAFAAALGQVRWLGRGAAGAYAVASLLLLMLVVMRGVAYPEISANTAPWYTQPGVIAGIPAIPWIMPGLLGVILLRRAGDEQRAAEAGNNPPVRAAQS
jgi:hypothetical protein